MKLEQCHRIYLTEIDQSFNCDTYFPKIDFKKFRQVFDPEVPKVRFFGLYKDASVAAQNDCFGAQFGVLRQPLWLAAAAAAIEKAQ